MEIDIISLFPNYFKGPLEESIIKRAQENKIVSIRHTDIRDFGIGKHQTVDDRPYGGGPGMVLMAEPLKKAIEHVVKPESHIVYLSPQGAKLNAKKARHLSSKKHLVLICGHYEGIDERIIDTYVDEQISIGDYVLTNGCLPAIVLIDSTIRFLPGVLGDEASCEEDSFENGLLDHPHYTRPASFEEKEVPEELLSGNHAEIQRWRWHQAFKKTKATRPDLLAKVIQKWMIQPEATLAPEESLHLQGLTLSVRNLDHSRHFYQNLIGLELMQEADYKASFAGLGNQMQLILIEKGPDQYISEPILMELTMEKKESMEKLKDRLRHHLPDSMYQLSDCPVVVQDPDGNIISVSSQQHSSQIDSIITTQY